MKTFANIEELRQAARRRLPRVFFDYVDGGAFSETTQRANTTDFERWSLEQRVLVDISQRNLRTTYLGGEQALPFMLGPTGLAGMLAHRGEVQGARAAGNAGIPFCQATPSICPMEEVRAATTAPWCFQLYVLRDRSMGEELIERALRNRADALFATVDATLAGRRERDVHNGLFGATHIGPRLALDLLSHPRWLLDMVRGPHPVLANLPVRPGLGNNIMAQSYFFASQIDPSLSWKDLSWLRERWPGRLIAKGIFSADDARRAVDEGVDGIVVSNHGGRQLDGALSSIRMLPEIVAAVGEKTEVLFDGGIRRGTHILKALALGARACLIGRAWLYGLGADGERGVDTAIDLLKTELELTMAFMGIASVEQLRAEGASRMRYLP